MSLTADIYTTLKSLCGGRVFADIAPDATAFPMIAY